MSAEELWTFTDLTDRLLEHFGEYKSDGRNHRMAREAVMNAYRQLPSMHNWSYYKRRHVFETSASYSTGTISFDYAGHADGNLAFVLSGGSWPSDADHGVIQIGDDHWPVVSRKSSTVVLGKSGKSPTSDIAAGTSYEWYREAYTFPVRTRRVGQLIDSEQYSSLNYVSPEEALLLSRNRAGGTTNRPELFTVRNDDRLMNAMSIVFVPPPSTQKTYEYIEEAGGQPLTEEKVSGTVGVSGVIVTATTAIFDSTKHVGCVIRIAEDGDSVEPTSLRGNLNTYNPAATTRVIQKVNSTTVCEIDSQPLITHTASKCVISSPADVETDSMLQALFSLCDLEYVNMSNDFDQAERNYRRKVFRENLLLAMEADRRSTEVQTAHQRVGYFPNWLPVGSVDTA